MRYTFLTLAALASVITGAPAPQSSNEIDHNQTWDVAIYTGKDCNSSIGPGRLGSWYDSIPWTPAANPECMSFYPYAGNSPYKAGSLFTLQGQVWDNEDHFPGKWGLRVYASTDCGSAEGDRPVFSRATLASRYSKDPICFNVPEGEIWGSAQIYANF